MSKMQELKDKIASLRDEYTTASKAAFSEDAKKLFADHPGLKYFSWNQYTPYFNDGDECTFRANTEYPHVRFVGEGAPEIGEDDEDNEEVYIPYDKAEKKAFLQTPYGKAVEAVLYFLKAFDNEVLRDLFDNHVTVKVTPEGTETEDYEHD